VEPNIIVYNQQSPPNAPLLPQAIDAEQAVLGGLMLSGNALHEVSDLLREGDFMRRDHQIIYRAICDNDAKNAPYDAVTVGDWCQERGYGDDVRGGAYPTELAVTTMSAANIRAYAEIVHDRARKRALIEACQDIINTAMSSNGESADALIASAAAKLTDITREDSKRGGLVPVKIGIRQTWEEIEERHYAPPKGITPPWDTVRNYIPTLENEELMVLAARPGMGKTANAMQWALDAAAAGKNVAVFSLEMSTSQLLTRAMSHFSKVPLSRLRQPSELEDGDWGRLNEAARTIKELPMALDDGGGLTIEDIRTRALRMHAKVEGGLGLVVVDYLQLVRPTDRKSCNSRNDEIAHISRELKQLARDLKCPVIAAAQLNRQVESRTNKTPTLGDLRDSGAIEQDADIICFLYRDNYYQTVNGGVQDNENRCNFIVAKNRNGQTGVATLRHRLECSSFDDGTGLPPWNPQAEHTSPAKDSRAPPNGWGRKNSTPRPDYRSRQAA